MPSSERGLHHRFFDKSPQKWSAFNKWGEGYTIDATSGIVSNYKNVEVRALIGDELFHFVKTEKITKNLTSYLSTFLFGHKF
ncbi:MAG TPA: hypothetical protein VD815_03410 [Candidatus Saccharimonadales bacterium]|nr:hypothetical protein [Candidatus Saccharimonadales bacterium]